MSITSSYFMLISLLGH